MVEYIELSNDATLEVTYRGVRVFEIDAEELVEQIAKETPFDDDDPELGCSYVFPQLEFALWRPSPPESENDLIGRKFATIGIGIKGYFSSEV